MNELDQLKKDFDHWRENKGFKHSPIPKELWKRAVELSKTIDPVTVGKTCQIPTAKIRQKLQKNASSTAPVTFAKASLPKTDKNIIELTTPSGITIKIYS